MSRHPRPTSSRWPTPRRSPAWAFCRSTPTSCRPSSHYWWTTGMPASRADFLEAVGAHIDLADLRWIYLTHPDRDHTGSLMEILEAAPAARLVTTFLGLGILSLEYAIPPERVFLLNPGQSLDLGDRRITAFRPPVYDSPATTGFYDERTGTCFSSDCFGAPMATAEEAVANDIRAVSPDDLVAGQRLWATVDSPWVTSVDRSTFRASLQPLRQLDPPVVLCSHLPPAPAAMATPPRHPRECARRGPVRRTGPSGAGGAAGSVRTSSELSHAPGTTISGRPLRTPRPAGCWRCAGRCCPGRTWP